MRSTENLKKLPEPELSALLAGKRIIIVGGTAGLGRSLAISALKRGASVTIVGRRAPDAALSSATFIQRDLSSLRAAAALVNDLDLPAADILVFTAGIITAPKREETDEGVEKDLAVSYLSRVAILRRMLLEPGAPKLGSARKDAKFKPRVFIMGYPGVFNSATVDDFNSEREYKSMAAHMNTVVGNEALVDWTNTTANGTLNVYGLNPGLIFTEIRNNFLGKDTWLSWFAESLIWATQPSAEWYAENVLVHLVVTPQFEDASTTLFNQRGKPLKPNTWLEEAGRRERVMGESLALLDRVLTKK